MALLYKMHKCVLLKEIFYKKATGLIKLGTHWQLYGLTKSCAYTKAWFAQAFRQAIKLAILL
jgi:hypothetical protein